MAKILIVGCGAIGSRLAAALAAQGHEVCGLKRQPPLSGASGIRYVSGDISAAATLATLTTDYEQLFFIVSPDGRGNEQNYRDIYIKGVDNVLAHFAKDNRNPPWIFVSSTSVYGQTHGEWVDEDSPAAPLQATSRLIRQAEQRVRAANPDNIVVRFSGIYGPGREYLVRLARQAPEIQREPPYYTNRIHEHDCVAVLAFLLQARLRGQPLQQCYLASDDDPAPMWEVISWLATQMRLQAPVAKDAGSATDMNKRCRNGRLQALGYEFHYPSYKEGYAALLEKYQLLPSPEGEG